MARAKVPWQDGLSGATRSSLDQPICLSPSRSMSKANPRDSKRAPRSVSTVVITLTYEGLRTIEE